VSGGRGRGRSGPPGPHYGLSTERADLAALADHSGATRLFGLSSGGVIALAAALDRPGVGRVAVYEPPLSIHHSTPLGWVKRYERELARGNLGAAAVTAMPGTRSAGPWLRFVPRPIITAALNAAARPVPAPSRRRRPILRVLLSPLRLAASRTGSAAPAGGDIPLRALVPTMRYDARQHRRTGPRRGRTAPLLHRSAGDMSFRQQRPHEAPFVAQYAAALVPDPVGGDEIRI
jgi:hypothetical protein